MGGEILSNIGKTDEKGKKKRTNCMYPKTAGRNHLATHMIQKDEELLVGYGSSSGKIVGSTESKKNTKKKKKKKTTKKTKNKKRKRTKSK
jgi:hypothetical protein